MDINIGDVTFDAAGMLSAKPNRAEDEIGGEDAIYNEAPGETPVPAYGYCVSRGRRPTNEDRISVHTSLNGNNKISVFGVYDGHVGQKASEHAKKAIPQKLGQLIGKNMYQPQQLEEMMTSAFKETDKEFCGAADANKWEDGTTACTVLVSGSDIVCANAGDSKAILCRLGKSIALSHEHRPHVPSESARVKAAGGTVTIIEGVSRINGSIACSRAIGDAHLKKLVIPDPAFVSRKLSQGDEFVIIATDGLWDYVDTSKAVSLVAGAGNAQKAAQILVDAALANGSYDNVSVVVIDFRSFWSRQVDTKSKDVDFNIPQKLRKLGEDVVARTDFSMVEPEACGWLMKESSGGMMGRRWQKRWFLLHVLSPDTHYDGSVHKGKGNESTWAMAHFVLHYQDNEDKSKTMTPRKPQFLDPMAGASREEQLDKDGMFALSVFEVANGEAIILAAETLRDCELWVRKLNQAFANRGYNPQNRGTGSVNNTRTLSLMEASNPNTALAQNGSVVPMPNGSAIRTNTGSLAATGPLQLTRTTTGGMRAVGGEFHVSSQQLADRDINSTAGLPRPGYVLTAEQAMMLGVPQGSVFIR